MEGSVLVLIELLLVVGIVVGFAVRELVVLRREKEKDDEQR
jgi:hypothetical protein